MSRPRVIVSCAQSLDGFIASASGECSFSSAQDLDAVHELRSQVGAILVGIGTVLADDPRLTIHRIPWSGPQPLRVVMDSTARTPLGSRILGPDAVTLLCHSARAPAESLKSLEGHCLMQECGEKRPEVARVLECLAQRGIASVMVEGGGAVIGSFLQADVVDELRISYAPLLVGAGTKMAFGYNPATLVDARRWKVLGTQTLGDCVVLRYQRKQ